MAAEADVGLGLSADTTDTTAYVPIAAGRFLFEPYFRLTERETETPFFTTSTVVIDNSFAIGIGIFRVVQTPGRVTVYYGARIAHVEDEFRFDQVSFLETDGDSIAPTIGFQFHAIERFSVGAEIGWEYAKLNEAVFRGGAIFPPQRSTSEIATRKTRADIILRFFC